jgi:hypothetical protein
MVKLSEQLNEALSQFKIATNGAAPVAAATAANSGRPELVATGGRPNGNAGNARF